MILFLFPVSKFTKAAYLVIQKLLKPPSTKTGESSGWQNKDDNDDDYEEDDDDDDDKMLLC